MKFRTRSLLVAFMLVQLVFCAFQAVTLRGLAIENTRGVDNVNAIRFALESAMRPAREVCRKE